MKPIFILVVILIIIPIALFLWPSFLGGQTDYLIVYGKSMLPTILPGSFVVTQAMDFYEIGDIVSYPQPQNEQKIIVHRIMEETEDGFIIRGDNNRQDDPGRHPPSSIIGGVVLVVPYAGYGIEFLRNPLAMGIIIVSLLVIKSTKKKKQEVKIGEKTLKKPDYGLFFPAIAVNLISYILTQISITLGIELRADMITSILLRIFEPYFASTLAFTFYFFLIIGAFYMAKTYNPKQTNKKSGKSFLFKKETNYALLGAQLLWLLFIMTALVHLVALMQALQPEIGL